MGALIKDCSGGIARCMGIFINYVAAKAEILDWASLVKRFNDSSNAIPMISGVERGPLICRGMKQIQFIHD